MQQHATVLQAASAATRIIAPARGVARRSEAARERASTPPFHSYKRRENPDGMASRVSVLDHFGAIRIEPRLGVPGETNVAGSWYARQTSLEIFKTKMLHIITAL
ncbi:hypothetical protein NKH72_08155 [Mesorhizobium sp. M0955]|uniref:hypothetical protein n=1 Tax=unclassified Mesorhizobium TaxID=325217 RepID=UPI00333B7E79